MAVKTAADAPPTPEQLQSVRETLKSPRRLKTEVLAGLVVGSGPDPRSHRFLHHRRRGSAPGPLCILHDGCDDRVRRRASGHDLGSHRRGRTGHRPAGEIPRRGLLHRRRHPGRDLPDHPGPVRGREADALHPPLGHGGLRQRPGDPDLHVPGPRTDQRSVAGLPACCPWPDHCVRPAEADQGSARPAGRHRGADPDHGLCLHCRPHGR